MEHTLTADGLVDMTPKAAEIRHCTWAECPGIEASVEILESEYGHHHGICKAAMDAPFAAADALRTLQHAKARLEELRVEYRAERMSYGELAELQDLAPFIEDGDVELAEAAGLPEGSR